MRPKRIAVIVLATLAVGYFAIVAVVFALQRSMIFPAPAGARVPRSGLVRGGSFIAFHLPGPRVVVHFHGNAEQLADSEWLGGKFVEQGLGFYAVEYPGYGLAAATPVSEEAIYAAAEAALSELEKTVPREQMVLEGQSLGTGVAVEMAKRGHGSKLVLLSAYTSIPDVAAVAVPFLPARLLVRDRFDTASKAKALALPVLLIHGSADEVIPVEMSRSLATLFPNATLKIIEGAHHNDLIDRPEVLEALVGFAR